MIKQMLAGCCCNRWWTERLNRLNRCIRRWKVDFRRKFASNFNAIIQNFETFFHHFFPNFVAFCWVRLLFLLLSLLSSLLSLSSLSLLSSLLSFSSLFAPANANPKQIRLFAAECCENRQFKSFRAASLGGMRSSLNCVASPERGRIEFWFLYISRFEKSG